MRRLVYGLALLLAGAGGQARAGTITINFDDPGHVEEDEVGATYAAQGVTFSNAMYTELGSLPGGSAPNAITSIVDSFFPKKSSAVVGTFAAAQTSVSITGLDVGFNGIRIDVYDAAVGGNLIGSSEAYGATIGGTGLFYTVSVAAAGIMRFELYQPLSGVSEGVAFDNLVFSDDSLGSPVPEPAGVSLLAAGAVGLIGSRLRRRKAG
jgi:hypothetical protein